MAAHLCWWCARVSQLGSFLWLDPTLADGEGPERESGGMQPDMGQVADGKRCAEFVPEGCHASRVPERRSHAVALEGLVWPMRVCVFACLCIAWFGRSATHCSGAAELFDVGVARSLHAYGGSVGGAPCAAMHPSVRHPLQPGP